MDGGSLYLGWRVSLLGFAIAQLLVLAGAIAVQPLNARANRLLALFLVGLAGVIVPYAIGFAGAYDLWRGLTFAPFALPLFLPPLLYGYTHALTRGERPARFVLHLLPGGLQAAYFLIAFALPMPLKWSWYTGFHGDVLSAAFDLLLLVSLSAYAVASLRLLRSYRAALADQRSDDDRFAARWLTGVIVALIAALAFQTAFTVWDWAAGGISYFQQTGLYIALSVIGLYLGVEGLRHGGLRFPTPLAAPPEPSSTPDWTALAADYDARLRAGGWAAEPDLSLLVVARRLATNTGRLSRAINQGLGVNFSAWINGVRAEGVAAALDTGASGDLLALAFDAGFSSKASFNRAFQARFGVSPSRYRRDASHHEFSTAERDLRRTQV